MKISISMLAVMVVLGGCSYEETIISPLFEVCAKLPADATYVLDKRPPVDFDEGILKIANNRLNVYIGHNPDFAKENRLGTPSDSTFVYVGKEHAPEGGKIIFAQRDTRNEILYVMFSGRVLEERSQLGNVLLSTCKKT